MFPLTVFGLCSFLPSTDGGGVGTTISEEGVGLRLAGQLTTGGHTPPDDGGVRSAPAVRARGLLLADGVRVRALLARTTTGRDR